MGAFLLIGTPGSGGGSPPATPTLSVADKGDGTGATATIAGSAGGSTNTVYTLPLSAASGPQTWTSSGSRSGDGAVNLALSDGVYLAICQSLLAGLDSAIGEPYRFLVTGGAAASVRQAIYAWLTSQTAVTALVGNDIFPLKAQQGIARPYVIYRRLSAAEIYQLTGSEKAAQPHFRFECVADSYASADAVRNALAASLDTIDRTAVGSVLFYNATIEDEDDDFDEPVDGGDTGVYLIGLTCQVNFELAASNP